MNPKVGIFFFIDNEILMDAVHIEKGEAYGDAIQHGGHYEFWESLKPNILAERKFKARAYDAYPRGRVVYFPKKEKYIIYADRCIKNKRDDKKSLFQHTQKKAQEIGLTSL
jgi:hypothetical protein